ncbi:MAG: hypothetical protein KAQ78_11385, partial [Candidatus Latescibacteria bacterium]|nr:hypothetical protein [Candidatus Latescibacterota bacterium]
MFEVKLKADLSDIEKLTKKYPKASEEARVAKLTEALLLLEREIILRTPRGAGPIHLADTIHSDVGVSGKKVWGITGTPAEHGEPVEHGTEPHFPPTGPIKHWVERVLGIPDPESKSVAFLIARSISKRGTKGAHMFEQGFE